MSQTGSSPDARPDDRRILNELEELQQAILASRATRERAEAAFDSELRAFDEPRPVTASAAPVEAPPAPQPAVSIPARPVAADPPSRITLPKPNPSPDVALFDDGDPPPAVLQSRSRAPVITAAIAALVGVVLALIWITTRGPETGPTTNPVAQAAPASAPPVGEPPPAKAVPADPHALRVDLTSLRRVWLRVSVDGRIALEREVAGGEQLPFGADRSIVVRAGDAGAVTVRVGTADQGPLGRDGQVITRAFSVPER